METDQILKDIQAFQLVLKRFEDDSVEQEDRLTFLLKQKEKKSQEHEQATEKIVQVKNKISNLEHRLSELDTVVSNSNTVINSSTSQKEVDIAENKIKLSLEQKEILEEEILELLDLEEKLFEDRANQATFISGISETIDEVKSEINTIIKNNENEIKAMEEKIHGLTQELPTQVQKSFMIAHKKHGFQKSLSQLKGTLCGVCKREQTRDVVKEVQEGQFHLCSGCQRLLHK